MGGFETGNNGIDLSSEFDGVTNKKLFLDVFKNVKTWYGENFTDEEIKEIKSIWNVGYNRDFKDKSDDYKKIVFGNRIDKYLFENRNEDYIDIDKSIIRKMNNASTQRKFRKIAIDLKKRLNVSKFSGQRLETIKTEFLKAKNNNVIPNIEKIINILNTQNIDVDNYGNNISTTNSIENTSMNEGNINNTTHEDFSQYNNIFGGLNIQISEDSNIFKTIALEGDIIKPGDYDESKVQTMKDYYNKIDFFIEKYNGDKDSAREILMRNYLECYSKNDINFGEFCITVFDEIGENDPSFAKGLMLSVDVNDDNDDDLYWDESENFTEEEKKDIESFVATTGLDKKELIKRKRYLDILSKKIKNKENLSDKEQHDYAVLSMLFGTDERGGYIRRSRKLKEIKDLQVAQAREYIPRHRNSSIEYATGNMKDIKPIAIVENNKQISNYIYGNKDTQEKLDFNSINLSYEDKIRLFGKLKEEKKTDLIFLESIKYLNNDLSINNNLVNDKGIEIQSVIDNQKKIEDMIKDLALEENLEKQDKNKINEINVRRSCMVCCFRAISKFFDNNSNSNGENFASKFEIKDVNENIEFDKKTGIIKMTGTIGVRKNHIGLYYNTQTGKLSFDNFLAYDTELGYKIGKGNGETEKLKIQLPTMNEMEKTANFTNFGLIDKLSVNMEQYNRMVGFTMTESVWFKCFKGFLGENLGETKDLVEQFNEKNILEQDIIKTIYTKFYNKDDLDEEFNQCMIIGEKNKPEQFKLIKLVSDSIDNYESANQLLEFRNYINKLDELLSSKDIVKNDKILTEFFADDLLNDGDIRDKSIKIIKNESKGLSVKENYTYEYYGNTDGKSNVQGDSGLNYYEFLNLLAKNKGDKRIIDLNEFKTALEIMEKSDRNLQKDGSVSFKKNYEECQTKLDLANLEQEMEGGEIWNN